MFATRPKAVFDGWEELCRLWCYAEDLESFEYACGLHLSYNAAPVSCIAPVRTVQTLTLDPRMSIPILQTR